MLCICPPSQIYIRRPFFAEQVLFLCCVFFHPCRTDTTETALCATEQVLFLYYVVFFQFVGYTGERRELGNGYYTHKCSPLNARLAPPQKTTQVTNSILICFHELYSNMSRPKKTTQVTNSILICFTNSILI